MTLLLVGLGLEKNSITVEALRRLKGCEIIYLENNTVNFPYTKEDLEKALELQITELDRSEVERLEFIEDAKKKI